jgi:hypothetical protein
VAPDDVTKPSPSSFPINKLVPFLRVLADPTGNGDISAQDRATIERVEANLAARDDDAPRHAS